MNDELLGVEELLHPDGFMNFYALLGTSPVTDVSEIQERINVLYQEAQTNRDHRVHTRRREYQLLMDVLPQARAILTDEARRKRYNAYLNAVEMNLPRLPYSEFFEGLMREKDAVDSRADILTIRDLSRLRATVPMAGHSDENLIQPEGLEETEEVVTTAVAAPAPAPVVAAPVVAQVAAPAPAPAMQAPPVPAPVSSGPVADTHRFSAPSLIGGGLVGAGMMACLPTLNLMPITLAAPVALVCAAVVAYVFSLTGEVVEA